MGLSLVLTLTKFTKTKCILRGEKKIYQALYMERKGAYLFIEHFTLNPEFNIYYLINPHVL